MSLEVMSLGVMSLEVMSLPSTSPDIFVGHTSSVYIYWLFGRELSVVSVLFACGGEVAATTYLLSFQNLKIKSSHIQLLLIINASTFWAKKNTKCGA